MHGWKGALVWCFVVCGFAQRAEAEAQVRAGDLRLLLDTELLSYGAGTIESESSGPFGDSSVELDMDAVQLGNAAAPARLGVGYAVTPQIVLGLRFGVGFQRQEYDDIQTVKATTLGLLPALTYVFAGERVKPFVEVGPLLEITRYSQERPPALDDDDDVTERGTTGGFVLAGGVLLFASDQVSIDLAAFFEARFGSAGVVQPVVFEDTSMRWFRGGLRLGLSLWT